MPTRFYAPATAIYEPDWRSGKAVPIRIARPELELLWGVIFSWA